MKDGIQFAMLLLAIVVLGAHLNFAASGSVPNSAATGDSGMAGAKAEAASHRAMRLQQPSPRPPQRQNALARPAPALLLLAAAGYRSAVPSASPSRWGIHGMPPTSVALAR